MRGAGALLLPLGRRAGADRESVGGHRGEALVGRPQSGGSRAEATITEATTAALVPSNKVRSGSCLGCVFSVFVLELCMCIADGAVAVPAQGYLAPSSWSEQSVVLLRCVWPDICDCSVSAHQYLPQQLLSVEQAMAKTE